MKLASALTLVILSVALGAPPYVDTEPPISLEDLKKLTNSPTVDPALCVKNQGRPCNPHLTNPKELCPATEPGAPEYVCPEDGCCKGPYPPTPAPKPTPPPGPTPPPKPPTPPPKPPTPPPKPPTKAPTNSTPGNSTPAPHPHTPAPHNHTAAPTMPPNRTAAPTMPPSAKAEDILAKIHDMGWSTLYDLIEQTPTVRDMLKGANGNDKYTVFTPLPDAFVERINAVKFLQSEAGEVARERILNQHVLAGLYAEKCHDEKACQDFKTEKYPVAASKDDKTLAELHVAVSNDTFTVGVSDNSADSLPIKQADVNCTNGYIQTIDGLLIPPDNDVPPGHTLPTKTLFQYLNSTKDLHDYLDKMILAGLEVELKRSSGERTVLAFNTSKLGGTPAFDKYLAADDQAVLKQVMQAHLLNETLYYDTTCSSLNGTADKSRKVFDHHGDQLTLKCNETAVYNSAERLKVNDHSLEDQKQVPASNGVLQYLKDGPIYLDGLIKTVVDVAAAEPSLSQLVKAINQAEMAAALNKMSEPVMVLAPSDAAFSKLPPGAQKFLFESKNSSEDLRKLLQRHTFTGENVKYLSDLKALQRDIEITSLSNEKVTVNVTVGSDNKTTVHFKFDGATASVTSDKIAANGAVHVIDGLISPYPAKNDPKVPDIPSKPASDLPDTDDLTRFRNYVNESSTVQDELSSPTANVTVFAPTNTAFDNAKTPVTETSDAATALLQRHVVSGIYTYSSLLDMARNQWSLTAMDGAVLKLSIATNASSSSRLAAQEVLKIEGSTVEPYDIWRSNAILHKIDEVITSGNIPADDSGIGGGWIFLIVLCILIIVGLIAYCYYSRREENQDSTVSYVKQVDQGGSAEDPNAFGRAFGNDYDARHDDAKKVNKNLSDA